MRRGVPWEVFGVGGRFWGCVLGRYKQYATQRPPYQGSGEPRTPHLLPRPILSTRPGCITASSIVFMLCSLSSSTTISTHALPLSSAATCHTLFEIDTHTHTHTHTHTEKGLRAVPLGLVHVRSVMKCVMKCVVTFHDMLWHALTCVKSFMTCHELVEVEGQTSNPTKSISQGFF